MKTIRYQLIHTGIETKKYGSQSGTVCHYLITYQSQMKRGGNKLIRRPMHQLNEKVKFSNKQLKKISPHSPQVRASKHRIQENTSILQANVSAIEASSFFSNRQDGSMDSMDQMIIGVGNLDEKSFEGHEADVDEADGEDNNKSKGSAEGEHNNKSKQSADIDFTEIHHQYEELFDKRRLLGDEDDEGSEQDQEKSDNKILEDEQWQSHHHNISIKRRKEFIQTTKNGLSKIQTKIEELSPTWRRLEDFSNNSIKILPGNLSEIHEEREGLKNNSLSSKGKREQDDEEEFIDFVSQPDPGSRNKSASQKISEFERQNDGWGDNRMLDNLEYEIMKDNNCALRKTTSKEATKNQNYQQVLEALDSKEEDGSDDAMLTILDKRELWIKSNSDRGEHWQAKEIKFLNKMREIVKDFSFDQQSDIE